MTTPSRKQCERIAAVLYDQIERIQGEAQYCGQVQQCEEVYKDEFVRLVADIIQKVWANRHKIKGKRS